MNNFTIISNETKDRELFFTKKIEGIIKKLGKTSKRHNVGDELTETDCVIVVGGDGTLLVAAREFLEKKVPLVGVNLGTLGFLVEIDVKDLEKAIEKIVNDDFVIEDRMLLEGSIFEKGSMSNQSFALNDIVIAKTTALSLIRYKVSVNGRLLYKYDADGIIVSTPTGSTGYSLSAGGPIVSPTADLIMLTPICAHSLGARSVILSPKDRIEIELAEIRNGILTEAKVVSDGVEVGTLGLSNKLKIKRSKKKTRLIKLDEKSFLETVRDKMN